MIFQLDLSIKEAIELGIEDMRKNSWLIDDMLSDCIQNPYLRDKYGAKQINACKEWFANNQIDIYMRPRNDKDRMPFIAIVPGPSVEIDDLKSLADQSTESIILMPQQINKPIPYIVKPFIPTSYDSDTGFVGIPEGTKGSENINTGMILVNPSNGQGYVIQEVFPDGVQIEEDLNIEASQLGILPQYQYYKARIEHTFFKESCQITCHGHGDPSVVTWMHSIALYSILRYRESLLEAYGFSQSSVSSSPLSEDPYFTGANGEKAYTRSINLSGLVENTWIKSPKRTIENVVFKAPSNGVSGGIKILSNLNMPEFYDKDDQTWITVDEDEN